MWRVPERTHLYVDEVFHDKTKSLSANSPISALNTGRANGCRRDCGVRIYEATIDVKHFLKHTFVLTRAAPKSWFSYPLFFDMKLSCKNIVSDTSIEQ